MPKRPSRFKAEYVLGYRLSPDLKSALVMEKSTYDPPRLSGVDGEIDVEGADETPYEAMVRVFQEKAGAKVVDWVCMDIWYPNDATAVYVFYSVGSLDACESAGDERIGIFTVHELTADPSSNLMLAPRCWTYLTLAAKNITEDRRVIKLSRNANHN